MANQAHVLELHALVARFANSFDLKEWNCLADCLSPSLYTDYRELRGTEPATMSREEFVESRREALQALQTHHLAGNVEIDISGSSAQLKVSMLICRRAQSGESLTTHCLYFLGAELRPEGWRFKSIRQKVLISDGDTRIHKGIVKR